MLPWPRERGSRGHGPAGSEALDHGFATLAAIGRPSMAAVRRCGPPSQSPDIATMGYPRDGGIRSADHLVEKEEEQEAHEEHRGDPGPVFRLVCLDEQFLRHEVQERDQPEGEEAALDGRW